MIEMPITEKRDRRAGRGDTGRTWHRRVQMIQDFVACIRDDTPPPLDIHAALRMALPACTRMKALCKRADGEIPDWES